VSVFNVLKEEFHQSSSQHTVVLLQMQELPNKVTSKIGVYGNSRSETPVVFREIAMSQRQCLAFTEYCY